MVAAGVLAVATFGCKKHKPPPMSVVALGVTSACAQVEHGPPVCWGAGESGQLGDGDGSTRRLPMASKSAGTGPYVALAVGGMHACGLHADGSVWCWGANHAGQLGTGDRVQKLVPARLGLSSGLKAVAAGQEHTCAMADDRVLCWGDDEYGQLGVAPPEDRTEPIEPDVTRGRHTAALALGRAHTCFAFDRPDRVVVCVGRDDHGQAAGGQAVLHGVDVVGLAAGGSHTCAALADGTARCWGSDSFGQLGDGGAAEARAPVVVAGLGGVVEVRAGVDHTCVRLRSNTVSCWGRNDHHQLADGTLEASRVPKPVFGLVGATAITAGGDATCARLEGGFVRCWGENVVGQLGDGTDVEHDVPMPVKWR